MSFVASAGLACLVLGASSVRAAPAGSPTGNLALDISQWKAHADGGNPPAIAPESSIQITGAPAMRLVYRDSVPHWGNVGRSVQIPPTTRAIHLRFYKHSAGQGATLHLWLLEPDGDRWKEQVLVDGKTIGELSEGWHDAEAPVGQFQYEPKGDGKRNIAGANLLLIGCNYADMDLSFTDVRFVLAGETPGASPAALPPPAPEMGERGKIAILAEAFVKRREDQDTGAVPPAPLPNQLPDEDDQGSPSAADPAYLADLARRAGYGVTLLSASALESPGYLSPNNFDLLVLPQAPYYPLSAGKAIQSFLSSGGSLFSTGGYAFDKPSIRAGDAWHTAQQALTVEAVDRNEEAAGLNHRFGIPGDGQGPAPGQIPLFDPMNPLKDTAYAESTVPFIPGVRIQGPFEGWAASALLGSNDPVFPKDYARRIPLLMGYDATGRRTGALGEIVHNYAGPWRQSSGAAFGVTNADLFSRAGSLSLDFADIVDRLINKVYLHSLKTDLFLYRPAEPVVLSVVCSNFTKQPVQATVQFKIVTRSGLPAASLEPIQKEIPPGFDERIQQVWDLPSTLGDTFYRVTCDLSTTDHDDQMETAFCVDAPDVRKAGPALSLKDNYLTINARPGFWLGTNQTGAVFTSAFEDPLVWERDLDSMRSHGLSIVRVLHFSPFAVHQTGKRAAGPLDLPSDKLPKETERKLDALVQLAAQHGIAVLLTLHDWMSVSLTDQELQAQKSFARLVAGRYKDCPNVFFDVQNEPYVQLQRADVDTALWNRYLNGEFKTQDALAAAWGPYLKGEKLGSVSLDAGAPEWPNVRMADVDRFRVWLFNRWMDANVSGVKAGSQALATVGYLQTMYAADQLLGNQHSDFTDKHYYGDKSALAHQIKVIDRRFEGKGLSLGEFGSVTDHNARIAGQSVQSTDADWYLEAPATVMGLGGMFALNWCWKEMPDNVFPWGINSPGDDVPRETLQAFRAFSLATSAFVPAYKSPQAFVVAPDEVRMGFGHEEATIALYRAIDAMIAQRVDFGVINEGSLSQLPKSAKLLVVPAPFVLSDAGYAVLKQFASGGGVVYVSGDISFDVSRKRTHPERLKELFGVEFVSEAQGPMKDEKDERGLKPSIQIKAAGAGELAGTSLWRYAPGSGQTFFTPYALELDHAPVDVYSRLVDAAGIVRVNVQPADPGLIVLSVPGAEAGARYLFVNNRTGKPQDVKLEGGTAFTLAPSQKAVIVEKAGEVVSLIAPGAVELKGAPWAQCSATCAYVSLDGKALSESQQIALSPFGTSEARIHRMPGETAEAWVGEVSNGQWKALALRPLQSTSDMLILPAETALRFSLITIAPKGQSTSAGQAVARRLSAPE